MTQPAKDQPEYRLVRILGRRQWYVRFKDPGSKKSIVRSTGETNKAAAEKWLRSFKKKQDGEIVAKVDDKFETLVAAWEAADFDTRSRFVAKLLKPIIGGKS